MPDPVSCSANTLASCATPDVSGRHGTACRSANENIRRKEAQRSEGRMKPAPRRSAPGRLPSEGTVGGAVLLDCGVDPAKSTEPSQGTRAGRRLKRPLERPGVFTGPQRDVCAFPAEFKALKQIAHALAQAVVSRARPLNLIDQRPPQRGGLPLHPRRHHRRGIVVLPGKGREQGFKFLRRRMQGLEGNTRRPRQIGHQNQNPSRHPTGVRQIEGHVEKRRVVRHGNKVRVGQKGSRLNQGDHRTAGLADGQPRWRIRGNSHRPSSAKPAEIAVPP